jgi:hypothetical protein
MSEMKLKINPKYESKINSLWSNPTKKQLETVNERGFPEPLIANCFKCHQEFSIKYNPAVGMPSQKNY